MRAIFSQIQRMQDGPEKDLLLKTFYDVTEYKKRGDKQSLEVLILRLNDLYDGMSDAGQQVSLKIVRKIMEEVEKL